MAPPEPDSQDQGPGGEQPGDPPLEPPDFPPPPQPRKGPEQATQPFPLLTPPPPGGLTRSPEELTRQIGWKALAGAVTTSASQLYPQDPKAAALTVAATLQPYLKVFDHTLEYSGYRCTSKHSLVKDY